MVTPSRRQGRGVGGQQPGRGMPELGGEELSPEAFEDFDVAAGELPSEGEEELAEELAVVAVPPGMEVSAEALMAARDQLEHQLMLNVTEQALAAESGSDRVGFENVVAVSIGEKLIDAQIRPGSSRVGSNSAVVAGSGGASNSARSTSAQRRY